MGKGQRRLRVLRAEQDVTQSQVARRSGVSQARYWQIENGEGPAPRPEERAAVAEALGVRPTDIAWPDATKEPVGGGKAARA